MVYDCLIIGAGHNGLVCAIKLAKAGRSVVLLEAADQVGGAACTREFAPGFRVSAAAHLLHLMPAELGAELKLETHGLSWAARNLATTLVGGEPVAAALGEGLSAADSRAYEAYRTRMRRFAAALYPILLASPPRLGTTRWADRLALLRTAWQVRKLGRRDMRELLRIGGMNVFDLLQENFESTRLKGALAFDAVLGANFGPRSPGTVLTLLYRLAAEGAAGGGGLSQPVGGMGALSEALARAAAAAGATIRTAAAVDSIIVDNDQASGVILENGERIQARTVISNADPKTTFLKLLGAQYLDTGFVRRVKHIRSRGLVAKVHLALKQLPKFDGVSTEQIGGRLLLAPSMEHLEHAYNHSKYGEFSAAPALEVTLPSVNDPALAPSGQHVLSAVVQYAPYDLKGGWLAGREQFLNVVLDTLETASPGMRSSVLAAELLTPEDIEQQFRISGGHWHHAELAFDQFMMVRPVPGAAQYRTPLPGLFLCGAGCHPGGGVMGIAGRNAALEVLEGASA
jgi:phytoene dehydrogenase-like protein